MRRFFSRVLPVLAVGLGLSGCVHYMPAAVSSAPLGSREHPVGIASGQSKAYYVLGFGPYGDDSLQAAIEDAKRQKNADTMINVFVDRQLVCFPVCGLSLVTNVTTRIYGTLVKYDDLAMKENASPMTFDIHLGGNEVSNTSPFNIDAFVRSLRPGDRIRLFLKNRHVVDGEFREIDANDALWIKSADGLFGSKPVRLDSIASGQRL